MISFSFCNKNTNLSSVPLCVFKHLENIEQTLNVLVVSICEVLDFWWPVDAPNCFKKEKIIALEEPAGVHTEHIEKEQMEMQSSDKEPNNISDDGGDIEKELKNAAPVITLNSINENNIVETFKIAFLLYHSLSTRCFSKMTEITCFHEKLFRFEVNTLCQLPRNTLYNFKKIFDKVFFISIIHHKQTKARLVQGVSRELIKSIDFKSK